MVHALLDQLLKNNHPVTQTIKTHQDLRIFLCSRLMEQIQNSNIFWVQNFSPQTWIDKMKVKGTWCDDVFLQLAANLFNKNIILIPLSPTSAHHAGMYMDIRSVQGGNGDPLFMLYFEEWRTAGHYQSLEIDPKVRYNMVLAHYEWRSNTFSSARTMSTSEVSSIPSLPPSPFVLSAAAPLHQSENPAPQLQSTRQRLESDGTASFSQVVSPITRHQAAHCEDQSDVSRHSTTQPLTHRPKPVQCKKKKGSCNHVIAFNMHYNRKSRENYTNYLNSQHAMTQVDEM